MTAEIPDDEEGAEVIFCTYGQCADATVPCPRCTTILLKRQHEPKENNWKFRKDYPKAEEIKGTIYDDRVDERGN